MVYRKIESIFKNGRPHWVGNGFKVKQYFPEGRGADFMERFSPFILMDYNEKVLFKGTNRPVGVGAHPHKGFETVTFAFEGKVEHGDNKGHSGIIESGDIQWMTAGKGIIHKEFHEIEYAKNDRIFQMIQLWVNLPKEYKLVEPNYQAIKKDEMGKYISEDKGVEAIVYAGSLFETKGPAHTFSPMNIYKLNLKVGAKVGIKENLGFNTGALILSGKVKVNEESIANISDFILFENEDKTFIFEALEDSEVFVLSGEPLNEPIAAMGPFVMNTYDEIIEANIQYSRGEFGVSEF